jgi:hypothetical protein
VLLACDRGEKDATERLLSGVESPTVSTTNHPATCREVALVATRDYKPDKSTDGEQKFDSPVAVVVPLFLPVTAGLAGNHKAELTFYADKKRITCKYRGGSSQAHPGNAQERALAQRYVFEKCEGESKLKPGDTVSTQRIVLHVVNGDNRAGRTEIGFINACPQTVPVPIAPVPPGETFLPEGTGIPTPTSDEVPVPPNPGDTDFPDPDLGSSNPEGPDGTFTPFVDPELHPVDLLDGVGEE